MPTVRRKPTKAKGSIKRKSKSLRETIQPHAGDKRYVRRSGSGWFTETQS